MSAKSSTPKTPPQSQAARLQVSRPVRVALVDADESIHLSVRQAFEELAPGWTLDAYSGADEALKRIPLSPPSVVLLDTLVSDSFGIECARRLKLVLPALPIVMHTAKADGHAVLLAACHGHVPELFPDV